MDKRATEILGLPIVALEGGKTLAHVEDFIVDPLRKQALALVVSERSFRRSARAIPFGRIAANGPDAIIVANDKVALEIERDPVLKQLDNSQAVLDARVLTDGGRELGTVTDMVLDDHTGEVKGYDVQTDSGDTRWLPVETVLSLGQKMVMVTGATATLFEAQAAAASPAPDANANANADADTDTDTSDALPMKALHAPTAREQEIQKENESPIAPVGNLLTGTLGLGFNLIGGTALNIRLLFGLALLVLGILILVNPAWLPLIAGISLIVIGLWIALQNAPGTRS